MAGEIEIHDDVGIHDGVSWTHKDTKEGLPFELAVLPFCVLGFPYRHAFVTFEDDAGEISDVVAVVTKFAHEAAVATVDSVRYCSQVEDVVIEGVAVDVINGVAFGDRSEESEIL